jgi:hypothetical protein
VEGYPEDSGIAELVSCPFSVPLEATSEAFQVFIMAEDDFAFLQQSFKHGQQLFGEFEDSWIAPLFRCDVNGFSFEVYVDPFETEEFSCSRPGFFAEL